MIGSRGTLLRASTALTSARQAIDCAQEVGTTRRAGRRSHRKGRLELYTLDAYRYDPPASGTQRAEGTAGKDARAVAPARPHLGRILA